MTEVFKNERQEWCPHKDCIHLKTSQNIICVGRLKEPTDHEPYKKCNTHRWCLRGVLPNDEVFDLQVNTGDLYWFTMLFDTIRKDAGKEPFLK